MSSLHDRSSIHRLSLEKWTKREQLCLASAVSCSGDQNWMTVSRSLKLLCGAHHPPDWFSQKHCAVKYGELLENVETPKRKKRTASDNASIVVETPTDSILRRLTEERIQELKSEIREQQETYAKLYTDVVHLQTGNSNEEQIRAMWMEIEREQEQDRQLKARKQMAPDVPRGNWRQGPFPHQKPQVMAQPKQEDMEIDETCKPQGTSPLLSSLLKSSSPAPAGSTTATTSTVRVNAPTITNLLTGGVMSSSSTTVTPSPSSSQASALISQSIPLSKPLTGPAPGDGNQATPTQIVLSPSQSAPTLSMLLEKTKTPKDSLQQQQTSSVTQQQIDEIKTEPVAEFIAEVKTEEISAIGDEPIEDGGLTPTKEEEQQLMEVFENLMPGTIDELADILTNNNGILNTGILEEESILEGVESLMDENQEMEDQLEDKVTENDMVQDSKNHSPSDEDSGAKNKEGLSEVKSKEELSPIESAEVAQTPAEAVKKEEHSEKLDEKSAVVSEEKIETISSDDSSDNVPLATHSKDTKAVVEVLGEIDEDTDKLDDEPKESPVVIDDGESNPGLEELGISTATEQGQPKADDDEVTLAGNEDHDQEPAAAARKASLSDSSDVIIIPTDDESNDGKAEPETKKIPPKGDAPNTSVKDEEPKATEGLSAPTASRESPFAHEETLTSICLPDTDDESSTFEPPQQTAPKEDKSSLQKQLPQNKKQDPDEKTEEEAKQTLAVRKLRDRDRSESPMVEDDASDNSTTARSRRRCSSTPVTDSIPNSPASSEDREFKVWKKSLMTVYNNLLTNKNASIFLRPFNEEQTPYYKQVCHRPMDLQIIKRHIENGTIRNVTDFQRDVFLMCYNAIMAFPKKSTHASMARELMHDFVQLKEQLVDSKIEKAFTSSSSSPYTPGMKVRGSARKSQRLP